MNFEAILLIFIFCEIYEFSLQKGKNLEEYLSNLLYLYKDGVVVFLMKNPTFFIILASSLYFDFQKFAIFLLFSCKGFDLIFKLIFLKRFTQNKPLGIFELILKENTKITFAMKLCISIFYIILFLVAFFPFA